MIWRMLMGAAVGLGLLRAIQGDVVSLLICVVIILFCGYQQGKQK